MTRSTFRLTNSDWQGPNPPHLFFPLETFYLTLFDLESDQKEWAEVFLKKFWEWWFLLRLRLGPQLDPTPLTLSLLWQLCFVCAASLLTQLKLAKAGSTLHSSARHNEKSCGLCLDKKAQLSSKLWDFSSSEETTMVEDIFVILKCLTMGG